MAEEAKRPEPPKTPEEHREHGLRMEILEKLSTLVAAAFGLVAALAWNNAITRLFQVYVLPRVGVRGEIWALVLYALLVTVVAVAVTIWIGRVAGRMKELKFPLGWSRTFRQQLEPPPPPMT